MGRTFGSKSIESPEEMLRLFNEYAIETKDNPFKVKDWVGKDGEEVYRPKERPLTMDKFEVYVGQDLHNYFGNLKGAYADYLSVCSHIKKIIRADQIEGGMAGLYNPSITQRLNGLVEKQQTELNGEGFTFEIVTKTREV